MRHRRAATTRAPTRVAAAVSRQPGCCRVQRRLTGGQQRPKRDETPRCGPRGLAALDPPRRAWEEQVLDHRLTPLVERREVALSATVGSYLCLDAAADSQETCPFATQHDQLPTEPRIGAEAQQSVGPRNGRPAVIPRGSPRSSPAFLHGGARIGDAPVRRTDSDLPNSRSRDSRNRG